MTSSFIIPFVGLKIGKHEFEFDIDDSFFETLSYSLIEKGKLKVWLDLEKKDTMLLASFFIDGFVEMDCSRCNDSMNAEIEGELEIIYKFGHETYEDENLIVISPDSYEIDVTQPIYELIIVSIPVRPIHEEGECNEEMVKLIEKYQTKPKDNDDTDPRWSALKNLN